MLNAYVQRSDVTDNVEFFLETKHGPSLLNNLVQKHKQEADHLQGRNEVSISFNGDTKYEAMTPNPSTCLARLHRLRLRLL